MIKLKNLNLNNFMSHVSSNLDFSDYEGLVLIEGVNKSGYYSSNGSGKSTLLEGIVYALTGDTLRGVSVNDVVNRNHKKDTCVSLKFDKDDTPYTISRYRKDSKLGDALVLNRGDDDISKRVNKETQKSLDDILGISYKVLVSTILLGEGLSSRFTQLSDPEKKSLIESTLNLNYDISAIRAKANNHLTQLKLDKSNLEGRISTLKEISSLDIESTKELLESNSLLMAKASKELEELNSHLANLQNNRESIESKVSLLYDTLLKYDNIHKEIERLDKSAKSYIDEITKVESAEVPHCSVCHQTLSSAESRESFINSYKMKIDEINTQILSLRNQLSTLPEQSIVKDKYEALKSELANIHTEISNCSTSINTVSNQYWSAKNEVDNKQAALARYEESTADISSLESEYAQLTLEIEKYDYFYKLFSPTGIIVNILSEAIDYINTRLSTYSNILLEKDYRLNFIKGKISLVDSKGSSYQSLSNGEKRRLDISIQFALHDYVHQYCGMKLDCCFIDEVLDTLDDVGVENIFEVLRLKLEYCQLRSIYVITHNSTLKDKFDRIITVSKDEKGDSYLI